MKQMTWDDYYMGFYDWSPSTQKSYAYRLTDYGPADEVWEVAQELAFHDAAFAGRLLEKALAAGIHFTPEQALEMIGTVEEPVLGRIAEQTDVPFNREQLEELYMMVDDAAFRRISRRAKIDILEDVPVSNDLPRKKRLGLFAALVAFAVGSALTGRDGEEHGRRCDEDCANCPPHYGYRYGRWYYGKGHQHGCEFGGNKVDGSR